MRPPNDRQRAYLVICGEKLKKSLEKEEIHL
jgi:hypothetical protein